MSQWLGALAALSEVLSWIAQNHMVTHKFYLGQGAISGVQNWSPCEELENKNGESGRSDRGYPSCLTFNTKEEKKSISSMYIEVLIMTQCRNYNS